MPLFVILFVTGLWSCGADDSQPDPIDEEIENPTEEEVDENSSNLKLYADFEQLAPSFYANKQGMNYEIVDNPSSEEDNQSAHCGKVVSTTDNWELLYSEKLGGTFDFEKDSTFTLMVRSSVAGKVFLKIEHPTNWEEGQLEVQQELTTVNKWTELTFNFTGMDVRQNTFGKIILLFDAGETTEGIAWYFDDLFGPPLEKTEVLMQRYSENPVLRPKTDSWYGVHIANAAILTPEESPDGKWRLYARGSGFVPEYHDQIGLFTQDTENFSPYGPWDEHTNNPVLPYGSAGSYDDKNLLDCAPVVGPEDEFYFYYNAKSFSSQTGALAGASSPDGGLTFNKFSNVLRDAVGVSDAIYHDGAYYIFQGDGNWNGTEFEGPLQLYVLRTTDPADYQEENLSLALPVGGGPDNFDSESVNGSRIFRLQDKWFMVYQGSNRHFDFPDRFHVAYSNDLLNWTKVDNDKPFFTRGDYGQWDQGGIWFGESFVHEGTLYMYYEGWGCDCVVPNRNKPYFAHGISQTGVAEVSVADFLTWCGL